MRVVVLLLGVLALAAPRPAAAAATPDRTTGVVPWQGKLTCSVGLQDLFRPADTSRLRSGLVTQVLIRVYLYRLGSTAPVAQAFRRSDVIYDIWDERFQVRVTEASGLTEVHDVTTVNEAITHATALVRFPVIDLKRLEAGATYRLGFRADLNPISQELVGEVRRWLGRPPEPGDSAPGDSFFGSFVSIFVNPPVEDSERQLRFFSQWFVRPRS